MISNTTLMVALTACQEDFCYFCSANEKRTDGITCKKSRNNEVEKQKTSGIHCLRQPESILHGRYGFKSRLHPSSDITARSDSSGSRKPTVGLRGKTKSSMKRKRNLSPRSSKLSSIRLSEYDHPRHHLLRAGRTHGGTR